MREVDGTVVDTKRKGLDFPTVITVEYEVEGMKYTVKETLKLKNEVIKFGFIPIGHRQIPKVKCEKGKIVTIEYDEKSPEKGHIKGNDGIINC